MAVVAPRKVGTEEVILNPKLFPTVLMVLNVCASAVYFSHGDWKKGLYWVSASVLTYTVTY